jgi:lysophospholipase L1-like esterase
MSYQKSRRFLDPRSVYYTPIICLCGFLLLGLAKASNSDAVLGTRGHSEIRAPRKDRADQGAFSMVVFGDSLGASTFAGTSIGQQLRGQDVWRLLRAMSLQYFVPVDDDRYLSRVKNIVAYEDFNAFSGSQEWSHRSRLDRLIPGGVRHHNYAIPGARTDGLEQQIDRFSRDFEYSPFAPAYIAISIGGNDFCDSFSLEAALNKLYTSIRRLREVLPQSLVLISGIPDVVGIFRSYDRVAFKFANREMTCKQRVQLFPMCARENDLILGDDNVTAQAKQDLLRYQRGFEELAQRIEKSFPDEGPVRYAPLPDLWDEDELLAADCFHPGVAGHHSIADATWQAVNEVFQLEKKPEDPALDR